MSNQSWMELGNAQVSDGSAIANTDTETGIFTAVNLAANFLSYGRVLRVTAQGRISNTGSPTIRFRLRYGSATAGVILADTGALTMGAITANSMWRIVIDLVVRSIGTTGTIFATGLAHVPITGSSARATAVLMGSAGETAPAAATVDTTAATNLVLTGLWGTADASNTLTGHNNQLEVLN